MFFRRSRGREQPTGTRNVKKEEPASMCTAIYPLRQFSSIAQGSPAQIARTTLFKYKNIHLCSKRVCNVKDESFLYCFLSLVLLRAIEIAKLIFENLIRMRFDHWSVTAVVNPKHYFLIHLMTQNQTYDKHLLFAV